MGLSWLQPLILVLIGPHSSVEVYNMFFDGTKQLNSPSLESPCVSCIEAIPPKRLHFGIAAPREEQEKSGEPGPKDLQSILSSLMFPFFLILPILPAILLEAWGSYQNSGNLKALFTKLWFGISNARGCTWFQHIVSQDQWEFQDPKMEVH